MARRDSSNTLVRLGSLSRLQAQAKGPAGKSALLRGMLKCKYLALIGLGVQSLEFFNTTARESFESILKRHLALLTTSS